MIIEIRERNDIGVFAPELAKILCLLPRQVERYSWSVLELEATSTHDFSLRDITQQIERSETGLHVSWAELLRLADHLTQVINGIFVACEDDAMIPVLTDSDSLLSACQLVIEALDSDVWRIYARRAALLKKIRERYRHSVVG